MDSFNDMRKIHVYRRSFPHDLLAGIIREILLILAIYFFKRTRIIIIIAVKKMGLFCGRHAYFRMAG